MGRIDSNLGKSCYSLLLRKIGVVSETVEVKSDDVKVITVDKCIDEKVVRETIVKTNFKTVSIRGAVPIERWGTI